MSNYRGFSTIGQVKKFKLTDLELVKQNLFNHFNIRKGEKLMQPGFGSVIWSMMFEPLTEETKSLIQEDVKKVVGYDPRTKVTNVIITQFDHGVQLDIEMEYLPGNQSDSLTLTFDNAAQTLTRS
jgi:phage baseplate assembly protein W